MDVGTPQGSGASGASESKSAGGAGAAAGRERRRAELALHLSDSGAFEDLQLVGKLAAALQTAQLAEVDERSTTDQTER